MAPKKAAPPADTKAKEAAPPPRPPGNPSTLSMVVEALRKDIERKGTSVPAIRSRILAAHPSVDPTRLRFLLRSALNKGLEKGVLSRPSNSNAKGATGRFKVQNLLLPGLSSSIQPGVRPPQWVRGPCVRGRCCLNDTENKDPNIAEKPKNAEKTQKAAGLAYGGKFPGLYGGGGLPGLYG
uniref:H15 domain-containing protein n=1 Tax=Leptobrachium leishanense TaxID=445787 RepID=A0A8C5MJ05_9ANUR